jgi:hypothetical protein
MIGANKKQIIRKTNIAFEIFNCLESNFLILFELIKRSGNSMISNKETILSTKDKLI